MAFMIVAVIRADVDSWISRYLNKEQTGWTGFEHEAFDTHSWPIIEGIYKPLIQAAQDNAITGREVPKLLKDAFDPAKGGQLIIVERVIKKVTTHSVTLK
jgi:hypothetical protein